MSITHIPAALRRQVAHRADFLCEYCLLREDDTYFGCEVDHIISISEKHGGLTQTDNLAYACFACNRSKGSDIASLVPGTARLVPLFHPRRHRWHEHFGLSETDSVTIVPVSDIGAATTRLLHLNDPDRLVERQALRAALRYPVPAAMHRLTGAM